jgi:hypothetical protein
VIGVVVVEVMWSADVAAGQRRSWRRETPGQRRAAAQHRRVSLVLVFLAVCWQGCTVLVEVVLSVRSVEFKE